jgi:hypothetical protein
MNREEQDALIDLGAATDETKGAVEGFDDHRLGLIKPTGLSDD